MIKKVQVVDRTYNIIPTSEEQRKSNYQDNEWDASNQDSNPRNNEPDFISITPDEGIKYNTNSKTSITSKFHFFLTNLKSYQYLE